MSIKLNVPYYSQNDNELWRGVSGQVQCAATSNAMLLAYMVPNFVQDSERLGWLEPECYYKDVFLELGWSVSDRGNHDAHTETLEELGLSTKWLTTLTRADISKSLKEGFPVVIGVEYKVSGHICIVVGETDKGYLIHDPYGLRLSSTDTYTSINEGDEKLGAYDLYSWETLDKILFNGGGWGRLRR